MMERRPGAWRRMVVLGVLGVLAAGCDTTLKTEERQVRLSADLHSYDGGRGIVARSTVCAQYSGYRAPPDDPHTFVDAEDEELRPCYEERLIGPAGFDEAGCVALDTPGEVTWELSRTSCSLPGEFGDDRVLFEVLARSEVRGAFEHAVPLPDELLGYEVELGAEIPEGYRSEVGEPMRVIEDGLRSISTAVVRGDRPEKVAVTQPMVRAVGLEGDPRFEFDEDPSTTMEVEGRAGDAFHVRLTLPAGEVDVGRVDVVARSEIASMSLHPVIIRAAGTDAFFGLGAVAITRDLEGRVLRQPPVEWSVVEGTATLLSSGAEGEPPAPGPEVSISDACEGAEPGEVRSVTIEGRIDDFRDTVQVEWDCVGTPAEKGCGCRSGAGEGAGGLGLLGLLLLRRRRRGGLAGEEVLPARRPSR